MDQRCGAVQYIQLVRRSEFALARLRQSFGPYGYLVYTSAARYVFAASSVSHMRQ